jgi:ribose-phosphate pyrophosphokinase
MRSPPEPKVSQQFTVFHGSANPAFAIAIARELNVPVGACAIDRFPDGEVAVQLLEPVRRKEVFLVQTTAPPVNDRVRDRYRVRSRQRLAATSRRLHRAADRRGRATVPSRWLA